MSERGTSGKPEKKGIFTRWLPGRRQKDQSPRGIQRLPETPDLTIMGMSSSEALARLHDARTGTELAHQIRQPEVPKTPMDEQEIRREAFALVNALDEKVSTWTPRDQQVLDNGNKLTNYSTQAPFGDKTEYFQAQVIKSGETTVFGNVTYTTPNNETGDPLREHFFYASLGTDGGEPTVYYVEHPYHLEDLGRPIQDTLEAVTISKRLIEKLPEIG